MIIGINRYAHAPPLAHAISDATAVADLLRSTFHFPDENITVLLDEQATGGAIRERFMSYARALQADDRLIVFFAGHGHTETGKRGEVGFLVPVDGVIDDLASLLRWDDLTRNADLIAAKHIFFVMDACYGGLALLRTPSFGGMRFMGDMMQRYSRQVLTAGKADETVADGGGVRPGHSIFTAHLLDALEGSAATEAGLLTATGVMAYVYDRVGRDPYSHQTPHYGFVDGDGDFIFDTSVLKSLRESALQEESGQSPADATDVLINPAPPIVTAMDTEPPLVEQLKDLLSDPAKRIKLDDFVSLHIRRFLDATDLRHFPVQGEVPSDAEIASRVTAYDEKSRDLQQIAILIATWSEGKQLLLLEKIFGRLAEADRGSTGLVIWLSLAWYPILYLMYSAGIAAIAARNYDALAVLLHTPISLGQSRSEPKLLVEFAFDRASDFNEYFKRLPGHERNFVPRSEYLFKALQPRLEDLLMLGRRYEAVFDTFELMVALEYAETVGIDWGPLGRFAWKHRSRDESPLRSMIADAQRERERWHPLRAGLFKGSLDNFTKDTKTIETLIHKLPWS